MKRTLGIAACLGLVALLFGFAGCLPESKNPIAPASMMSFDSRLEGVWKSKKNDDEPTYYHFHHQKGEKVNGWPWMEVIEVGHEQNGGLTVVRMEALSAQIGSSWYLCFREVHDEEPVVNYNFLKYDIDWTGTLQLRLADENALAKDVEAGKLKGTVKHSKFGPDVRLTDSSARIAAYIASPAAKNLFNSNPVRLKQIAKGNEGKAR